MPDVGQAYQLASTLLATDGISEQMLKIVAGAVSHMSFSEIERDLTRAKRAAVMSGGLVEEELKRMVHGRLSSGTIQERKDAALMLLRQGLTQTDVHGWTGLHRDVIRSMQRASGINEKEG
jgi:hypothetical protein